MAMIEKRNLIDHNCSTNLCKNYQPTEKEIPVSKNRKRYVLINNSACNISKYDVDDCVFKDIKGTIAEFTLCDNIIVIKGQEKDIFIWIELKGADENHACTQIKNTMESAILFNKKAAHFIRIISGKSIKVRFRNDDNKYLRKLYDRKNHFLVRTNFLEEKIDKSFELS